MESKLWRKFELTGSIENYLDYKSEIDYKKEKTEEYNAENITTIE